MSHISFRDFIGNSSGKLWCSEREMKKSRDALITVYMDGAALQFFYFLTHNALVLKGLQESFDVLDERMLLKNRAKV